MNEESSYASVRDNGKFILIDTWSGLTGGSLDPKGGHYVIPVEASGECLATTLLDALSCSRVGTYEDYPDFYDIDREQRRKDYVAWIESSMQRCGYKTKRALFKNMKSCHVERHKGSTMNILPSVHDSLEGWAPLPGDQTVVIPWDSSPTDIGAAVRLALSRCIA